MSWWSDVVLSIESAMGGESNVLQTAGPAEATVPNISFSGFFGPLVTALEAIWAGATDGKFWRSLGWIILGIVLMLAGVLLWIGPSAGRRSPVGMAAQAVT